MNEKRGLLSRKSLSSPSWIWAVGGAGLGLTLLLLAVLFGPLLFGDQETQLPLPDVTVLAYSSSTPAATATAQPTVEATATETSQIELAVADAFIIGELVEVRNTDGDALRLRSSPSLSAPILVLGLEFEVFEVLDGPVDADGYRWWFLANPYEDSKRGWAVDVFLSPLQSP